MFQSSQGDPKCLGCNSVSVLKQVRHIPCWEVSQRLDRYHDPFVDKEEKPSRPLCVSLYYTIECHVTGCEGTNKPFSFVYHRGS